MRRPTIPPWLRTGLVLLVFLGTAATILYRSPESASSLEVSDSVEYATAARSFAMIGRYQIAVAGEAYPPRYPPAFPLAFLAPVYWLTGGDNLGVGVLSVLFCSLMALTIVFFLCLRILGSRRSDAAAFVVLFAVLNIRAFYVGSRQIMSDVPVLALSLLALFFFLRLIERPSSRVFVAAGVTVALAASIRMTFFSLCLPFLFLLMRRIGGRRIAWGAAFMVPLCISVLSTLAYNTAVFGRPLTTGYHYWLPTRIFSLTTKGFWTNLISVFNPFMRPLHLRSSWEPFLGLPLLLVLVVLGILCYRLRPAIWRATLPAMRFLALAMAPVVIFHLFFPFPIDRFALATHVLVLTIGVIWLVSLTPIRSTGASIAVVLLCIFFSFWSRPPAVDKAGSGYVRMMARAADEFLPEGAVLVSTYNPIYLADQLDSRLNRSLMPLDMRSPFATFAKPDGDPSTKQLIFPVRAAESPHEVAELLRSGTRVYVETLQPGRLGRGAALEQLLAQFETTRIWPMRGRQALVELHLRDKNSDPIKPE